MFLKTLSIKGFKSFADATSLTMEPGITVVVGPNGSGKSNVVDAIGWVLGAQAPSTVRSQKMDDVIFAGTEHRPALGRAEVALTIDNSVGMLPIEFTEVTITRTLFRGGDSEYALNGVPCRLLDIQELLSDSGVGRQQHVIISQGQIDAVLNARPEERRLIIEEAAGVLKFRRRKEKAERRLAATEANLTRLQDLLREVRRQLRPLERQADAARRHGAVTTELTGLRRYLAGQELARLLSRSEAGQRTRGELGGRERLLRDRLRQLDTDVVTTETRLSVMGGDDLGEALGRFESLREKARGLAAVLTERRRGIERDRAALVDGAVIANLEAESARLADELAEVERHAAAVVPEIERLRVSEVALEADREAFRRDSDVVDDAGGERAREVRHELVAARSAVARGEAEAGRARARLEAMHTRAQRLDAENDGLGTRSADAARQKGALAERLDVAASDRAAAEDQLRRAEDALEAAERERHSWAARADALALALDEARARAGAERLGAVDGVIGTLVDVVEVDPGWESAFAAVAGDAVAAVVFDGVDTGRCALGELHAGGLGGAVLAMGAVRSDDRRPRDGELVRGHVRGRRPGVDALLDALVGSAVVVDDWSTAVDGALSDPGAVVVTQAGDRFGPTGWWVGRAQSGATGAALDEARERSGVAAVAADSARGSVLQQRDQVAAARHAESGLTRAVDQHDALLNATTDALQRLESDRREVTQEVEALAAHVVAMTEELARDRERLSGLEALLPALEAEEARGAELTRAMAEAGRRLDERARELAALRNELEVRSAGVDERRQFLRSRLADVDERLSHDLVERRLAESRRIELDQRARATERLSRHVGERLGVVETELAALRESRRRQTESTRSVATALDLLRRERSATERELGEVREHLQRAELADTETRLRLETAVESLRRDLDCEPEDAMAADPPELAESVTAPARARELERELRLMGAINPLALEEHEALQERHEFLQSQLEDVKSSRRDLAKVIRAIDGEIVNVFASAFADVSQNFASLFETLFPGGRGQLRLTEPENLLDTGIEVEARPSGKNVRKLSLLSGGERSLTALAYLFAIFRARPSPFYVMDEVEAALDDVNLHRFLDLVHEFRADAQLIVVSHQKRTMEAADCLYGVTMQSGGSSRVVSERMISV